MNLFSLTTAINGAHHWFINQSFRQINKSLTLRNWIIGMYIREYEQHGADRAQYGEKALLELSEKLRKMGLKGMAERRLREYRQFYQTYPQIRRTASAEFQKAENQKVNGSLSMMECFENTLEAFNLSTSDPLQTDTDLLINQLSYSHFLEFIKCDTSLQRIFYETECLINHWNVRELQRAMNSLLFERTGLSKDKYQVLKKYKMGSEVEAPDVIRNPYILEFLGLEEKPEFNENDLEQAIIDHLHKFLLELGRGFCFEARQKRITFGNKHYRIDLVFYHRILKCHILIDLKIGDFDHSDAGQMNLYLNYFRENEMIEGDNPPVGVILCAQKDVALVHYATGNLSQSIFVSKYLVNLPSEEQLRQIVKEEQERLQ